MKSKDTIIALQEKVATMERQLKEAKACQIHNLYFASDALKKASVDKLFGSGVILELTFLGGKAVFDPVLIVDGLSNETIAALTKDMARAFNRATELKPKE